MRFDSHLWRSFIVFSFLGTGWVDPEKEKGIYFPVRKVPEQIQKCLEPSLSIPELYGKYAKTNRSSEDDLFVVLKGMSSSTPAMMNSLYDTTAFTLKFCTFSRRNCRFASTVINVVNQLIAIISTIGKNLAAFWYFDLLQQWDCIYNIITLTFTDH